MNYRKLKLIEARETEGEQIVEENCLCHITEYGSGSVTVDNGVVTTLPMTTCSSGELKAKAFELSNSFDWVIVKNELNLYLIPLKKEGGNKEK